MPSRCRRVTLPKAFEYKRQEVWRDTNAVVSDDDADISLMRVERQIHASAFGRKLQGIRQEIRHDLLEARWIRMHVQ
jgi:hypothetical protein